MTLLVVFYGGPKHDTSFYIDEFKQVIEFAKLDDVNSGRISSGEPAKIVTIVYEYRKTFGTQHTSPSEIPDGATVEYYYIGER